MPVEIILTPAMIEGGEFDGTAGEASGERSGLAATQVVNVSYSQAFTKTGWGAKHGQRFSSFHRYRPRIPAGSTIQAVDFEITPCFSSAAALVLQIGLLSNEDVDARWADLVPQTLGMLDPSSAIALDVNGSGGLLSEVLQTGGSPDPGANRQNDEAHLVEANVGFFSLAQSFAVTGSTDTLASIRIHLRHRIAGEPVTPELAKPGQTYSLEVYATTGSGLTLRPAALLATSSSFALGALPDADTIGALFLFDESVTLTNGLEYVARITHSDHEHDTTETYGPRAMTYRDASAGVWAAQEQHLFAWGPNAIGFHPDAYPYDYLMPWPTGGDADTVTRPEKLFDIDGFFGVWVSAEFTVPTWTIDVAQRWGRGYGGEDIDVGLFPAAIQKWIDRPEYTIDDLLGIVLDPHDDPAGANLHQAHSSSNPAKTGARLFIQYDPPGAVAYRTRARPAVSSRTRARRAVSSSSQARPAVSSSTQARPAVSFATRVRPAVSLTTRIGGSA